MKVKTIAVLGDGGWGTTLAIHLANQRKYTVQLWGAFPQNIREMQKTRYNQKYLPGIKIPQSIKLFDNLKEILETAEVVVLATPAQHTLNVLRQIKAYPMARKIFLSVIKGIDTRRLKRMSEIIEEELGAIPLAVLSGPTIAREVALGIPSTAVIVSKNIQVAQTLQKIFNSKTFRLYTNQDLIGVEIGGSIKNVIAIACGVCDGLGFGTNAKAAILTRGLAEMARLGKKLGGKTETFYGLTGLGDLVTTCVNEQSRNRSVGEALGQGKTIRQIVENMHMVAEGVETAKAVYQLSLKHKIPMPITREVFNIVFRDKNPRKAVSDLMGRKLKAE